MAALRSEAIDVNVFIERFVRTVPYTSTFNQAFLCVHQSSSTHLRPFCCVFLRNAFWQRAPLKGSCRALLLFIGDTFSPSRANAGYNSPRVLQAVLRNGCGIHIHTKAQTHIINYSAPLHLIQNRCDLHLISIIRNG